MKEKYIQTKTTVSYIKYHLVFCPRYRRKIFNIEGLAERFINLVTSACTAWRIEIFSFRTGPDYVYMHVGSIPELGPAEIMKIVREATSHVLREEFPQLRAMPSLWTRNYFVSTESNISDETIDWYVSTLKTRP